MVKAHSNPTIYARIFVVFTLLIAIPCFVLLGYYYLNTLSKREQAISLSFDTQNFASLQQANLQGMNALLQARFNQIFASLSGNVTDPSLSYAGGLMSADIVAREADFSQVLQTYQTQYEVATSSNMDTIRSILLNDNPEVGPAIIASQQNALYAVATPKTGLWPRYQILQKQENALLDSLDPTVKNNPKMLPPVSLNARYKEAYSVLWHANFVFTDLRISWLGVLNNALSMGKTVAAVGPLQNLPVYVSIVFTCTLLLIFAIVWSYSSFLFKRLFSFYPEGKNSGNTPVPPSGSIPPAPQLP